MRRSVTVALAAALSVAAEAQAPRRARMSEMSVRRLAVGRVAPEYPAASLSGRLEGVAVTAIVIGPGGDVVTCRVLEAPDRAIGAEACGAALQWTFRPITTTSHDGVKHPLTAESRLTFYFRIGPDGKGVVEEPSVTPRGAPVDFGATVRTLVPAELEKRRAAEPITLVDVRERGEFREGHREGAVNIPAIELAARTRELTASTIVVLDCPGVQQPLCPVLARELSVVLPNSQVCVLVP